MVVYRGSLADSSHTRNYRFGGDCTDHLKKHLAVMTSAVIVMASFGAVLVENADESDAFPWTAALMAIALVAESAYIVYDAPWADDHDIDYTAWQNAQITTTRDVIDVATSFHTNNVKNYSELYKLTYEHFARNAELSAAALWSKSSAFNPDIVLETASNYLNASHIMHNSIVQINEFYNGNSGLSAMMNTWQNSPLAGKLHINWSYGEQTFGSKSSFKGEQVYVASVPLESSTATVYIGDDATVTAFNSTSAALTSTTGVTIYPVDGVFSHVAAGVYTIQAGAEYASDKICQTVSLEAADVVPGIIMKADSTKLATYNGTRVYVDGASYSNLDIKLTSDDGKTATVGLTNTLAAAYDLCASVHSVMSKSAAAASSAWAVYNNIGKASAYISSLVVPDSYNNINVSATQKIIMTTLAMSELAQYYEADKLTKTLTVSGESNALFCHGTIYNADGTVAVQNAVFTPYYYASDQTLTNGKNSQTQACICTVWSTGENNIGSWSGNSSSSAALLSCTPGMIFDIAEMQYNGLNTNTMDLKVSQIDYINPEKIIIAPLDVPDESSLDSSLIKTLIIIAGAMIAVAGVVMGRFGLIFLGIAMAVLGLIYYDTVASMISKASWFRGLFD